MSCISIIAFNLYTDLNSCNTNRAHPDTGHCGTSRIGITALNIDVNSFNTNRAHPDIEHWRQRDPEAGANALHRNEPYKYCSCLNLYYGIDPEAGSSRARCSQRCWRMQEAGGASRTTLPKALRGGILKVNLQEILQLLAINAYKMAPRTTQRLQE